MKFEYLDFNINMLYSTAEIGLKIKITARIDILFIEINKMRVAILNSLCKIKI